MLDRLKAMAAEGQWQEILRTAPDYLTAVDDVQRAELHAILAVAYAGVAEGPSDWRHALEHAHACLRLSEPGGFRHGWALHMLACTYVDTGHPRLAQTFARLFLERAADIPELARFVPWVTAVLARVAYQKRSFVEAARIGRRAMALFEAAGKTEQVIRTAFLVSWAYARAGRPGDARRILPDSIPDSMAHLKAGTTTAILAAEGCWPEVLLVGARALKGHRESHDNADAAEICLLMAEAARRTGSGRQVLVLTDKAAHFAALQAQKVHTLLVLSDGLGGGEPLHVCAASRGSADLRDRGCFTTGIA